MRQSLIAVAMILLSSLFSQLTFADIVGDVVEASLTIDPDTDAFDDEAIGGTAMVVDPGREFQAEVHNFPNNTTIDFYIDLNNTELTFGFLRTDTSNGGFGSGGGRILSLTIWDIDPAFEIEYLSSSSFGATSSWEGDAADFALTTTDSSIRIDFGSQYSLEGNGGEISATYSITTTSVPEPSSALIIGAAAIGLLLRRRKS